MTEPVFMFFLILGLVMGGTLTWFVMATRPFETAEEPVLPPDPMEPPYLVDELRKRGRSIDEATAGELLEIHRAYLEGRIREERAAYEARVLEQARDLELERRRAASEAAKPAGPFTPSGDADPALPGARAEAAAEPASDPTTGRPGG